MITSERIVLLPATGDLLRAALDGSVALAEALGAEVPESWPPEYLDDAALTYTLDRLSEGPDQAGWWLHFVILEGEARPVLIGSAGYKGPPGPDGTVEIGYGIVADRRRQGYATEAPRVAARVAATVGIGAAVSPWRGSRWSR